MKNFEEQFTAWLDGTLNAAERERFEAELPDLAAARREAAVWRNVRADLREVLEPEPIPHADFLNSQVQAAIARETTVSKTGTEQRGGWFSVGRLAWAGALLLVVAGALSVWWVPRDGGVPDEARFISQVVEARSADPKLGAYAFAAPGGKGAVLWVDDAGFIPANERIK